MAVTHKILGQAAPAATTETDLYTVPGATTVVVSSVIVCNRGTSATTFRVSASVDGAATANKDYIAYDVPIEANESISLGHGLTMDASDKMRVFAGNGNLSFGVFGQENS